MKYSFRPQREFRGAGISDSATFPELGSHLLREIDALYVRSAQSTKGAIIYITIGI